MKKLKLFSLALMALFATSVWATCDPGTIFKFEVKNSISGTIADGDNVDLSSYVTTTAGSVTAYVNSGKLTIDNGKYLKIADKGKAHFICALPEGCSLQAGDIIKYSISSYNALLQPATNSGDDDKLALAKPSSAYTLQSTVIPSGHALIGKSSFYIYAPSNGGLYKSIEIVRPATITLDATTNGGTAVDAVKGAVGDKVVLPHAFKKDAEPLKYYKFKGWYDNASAGTKQADYYSVSSSSTLYAQFEDNPTSGTMFSLEMQNSMKPASEVTVKSGTGFVTELDLLQYALISGGAAKLKNNSTNNHAKITTSGQISFAGSNGNIQVDLDFPLAVGDEIATNVSAKTWVTHSSTNPGAGPYVDGTNTSYTIKSTDTDLIGATTFYLWRQSNATLSSITITRPTPHTLSSAVIPTGKGTVALGATSLIEGATTTATYSAIDGAYEFDEWQISGTGASLDDASANPVIVTMGSEDAVVTLKLKLAVTKYTITYSKGAYGTGDAIADGKKDEGVDFTLSSSTYSRDGYVQTGWSETDGGVKAYDLGGTYSTDADEELFPFWTPVYTVTKGTHANGDFTISPSSLVAGGTVTLDPTPADGYMFSAWEIVKTSDASATGITVTNNQFEMPAYGVTVNATFVADTRKKILYITTASTENDKVYKALKDDYNITTASYDSDADQTTFDLVVLHESVGGGNYNATAIAAAKSGTTPVLNTKSFFYTSARWNWGNASAGNKTKGVRVNNTAYCNITSHPLFNGLTPDANDSIIILSSINSDNKPIQPVTSFTSGKEGYTLANVPGGCAIHELTPAQRGAESGKYLLISLYSKDFSNLNADGQKLFKNAADYLTGNTAWEPIAALSAQEISADPTATYSVGNTISLTASATGTSAATTYAWYKGDTWAEAEAAGTIQDAKTAAAGGNTYEKASCIADDAGTYWCLISNGTDCDVKASLAVTVSTVSYNITFVSAHGTAPSATEGVSYELPELTESGWAHQGWTADIDVTVDAATVIAGTLIANGKTAVFAADVNFTAVWTQVFEVTFDLQDHGAAIAPQDILDGGKVAKPTDPVVIGWDFGGWYKESTCDNEWDFDNDVVTQDTALYALWTEFTGCTMLYPATSGSALAVGDTVNLQEGSKGAAVIALAIPEGGSLTYTANGLGFNSKSGVKAKVVLSNNMKEGTKISMTLVAGGDKTRGLYLYSKEGAKVDDFTCWVESTNPATKDAEDTFTYTVEAGDGLIGTNEFQLWRNNTVYLKCLKVENCGSVPTAIDETTDEAKAVKFIKNGQLFIEMNGKTYNAMGQEIR